jgi:hypothetical protein
MALRAKPDVLVDRTLLARGDLMHTPILFMATIAVGTVLASKTSAQSARDIRGPSPLVAIENEAPAKLVVDPPLPEP